MLQADKEKKRNCNTNTNKKRKSVAMMDEGLSASRGGKHATNKGGGVGNGDNISGKVQIGGQRNGGGKNKAVQGSKKLKTNNNRNNQKKKHNGGAKHQHTMQKHTNGNNPNNSNRRHNNKPRNRPPQKRESTSSPSNQSTQKNKHNADTNWNKSKMGKKNQNGKKKNTMKNGRTNANDQITATQEAQKDSRGGAAGMLYDPNSGSMVTAEKQPVKQTGNTPPRPRTICLAEEHLIQTIEQTKSQTASIHGEENKELLDIPKDKIKDLPEVPYKQTKKIVLVTNATASNVAVALIRKELTSFDKDGDTTTSSTSFQYLGFDTETRPKFNKGGNNHPPALLQLATSTTAYLFRLKHEGMHPTTNCPMTEALHALLVDTSIIKVGVGIHEDITELQRTYGQSTCGNGSSYLDLGPLAKIRHPQIKRAGLRNLTATLLNWKLSKAQQMKNWEMKTLTVAMEAYAASDALVALDLLAAIIR